MPKKNEMSSDLSVYTIVKGRHRANGLFFEIKMRHLNSP